MKGLVDVVLGLMLLGPAGSDGLRTDSAASRASLQIDAAFPGGNIIIEKIEGNHVLLRPDRRDTPRWWFYWYFRVRGAAGRTLTFSFTDGNPIGVRGPAVSLDRGRTWSWLGVEAVRDASFTYQFAPQADDVRFCFTVPYLEVDLRACLERLQANPHLRLTTLCRTNKGRDVECIHLGRLDGSPSHRVLLTARHHACETMANFVLEGLLQSVLTDDEQEWLRDRVEFLIVPFVDKDGVEDGDQGKLRAPRDPYRDYVDVSIYPATKALRELVPRWADGKLRIVLDLHCPFIRGGRNEMVFFAGVSGESAWQRLEEFSAVLESLPPQGLPYRTRDNLPFGQEWNTPDGLGPGQSLPTWAAQMPGVQIASTLEITYANACGTAVTPGSARVFGRDLARAIRLFLQRQVRAR